MVVVAAAAPAFGQLVASKDSTTTTSVHIPGPTLNRFPRPASPDLFSGVSPGVARNFQVFDALDFIAELTQHIPDPRTHLVRYFGFYSNKSRGLRAN